VDVKIIKVEPAEQAEALKSGDVAAASAPAPWPTVAKQAGATALLDWKQILDGGKYLQGVAFTTKKFADANPNFVRAFVQAHRAITDDLNKNRAAGDKRVLAAWEKDTGKTMKPAVAAEAFKTITFTNESTIADWNRVQDIAAEVGILRKKGELAGFLYEAK
jgi:ABC-type nitrate/sulfonate/bicarbonate transport system substrate-binding protein